MAEVDFDTLNTRPVYDEQSYTNMLRKMLPIGPIWGFTQRLIGSIIQDTVGNTVQDGVLTPTIQDVVVDETNVSDSLFGRFWSVIGAELARFEARSFNLVLEYTPGKSVELLEQWEEQAGLPEECLLDVEQTQEERQIAVHMKLYRENETITVQYLIDYAANLGYVIEIEENGDFNKPFIVGVSSVGDRLGQYGVRNKMLIRVIEGGEDITKLQCTFSRILPAHVSVIWEIGVPLNYFEAGTTEHVYDSTKWTILVNSGGGSIADYNGGLGLDVIANGSLMGYVRTDIIGTPDDIQVQSSTVNPPGIARAVGLLHNTNADLVYINFALSGVMDVNLTFFTSGVYYEIPIPVIDASGDVVVLLDFSDSGYTYDITVGADNFTGVIPTAYFSKIAGWGPYHASRYGTERYDLTRFNGTGFPYNE